MTRSLFDHESGCTPFNPCIYCRLVAELMERLSGTEEEKRTAILKMEPVLLKIVNAAIERDRAARRKIKSEPARHEKRAASPGRRKEAPAHVTDETLLRVLSGIGPAVADHLESIKLRTVGEVRNLTENQVRTRLSGNPGGKKLKGRTLGRHFGAVAKALKNHGLDFRSELKE